MVFRRSRGAIRPFGRGVFLFVAALLLWPSASHAQHAQDYWIFSTTDGGGELTTQQPLTRVQPVFESLCLGGQCLYINTDPGFLTTTEDLPGLFVLDPGTAVRMEVVAIDSAASVKVGSTVLDAPGESALLGTAPGLHLHPAWQVVVPEGTTGDFPVEFLMTADSSPYADSATFTIILTNAECGDGIIEGGEECDDGNVEPGDGCSPECLVETCSDLLDNDGDGRTDYPADPGCSGPEDVSELGNRACDDGLDNDEDGLTDFSGGDPECTSPFDPAEACGLGFELALIVPILLRLRLRARGKVARP